MSTPGIFRVGDDPLPLTQSPIDKKPTAKQKTRADKSTRAPRQGSVSKPTSQRFSSINQFADSLMKKLSRCEIAVWLLLWRDTKPDGLAATSQAYLAQERANLRFLEDAVG